LEEAPEISDAHDIHIWEITSQMYSMTAHLLLREDCSVSDCAEVFRRLEKPLLEKFQISHVNFSPEFGGGDFDRGHSAREPTLQDEFSQ
jgi:cobalt-zinc-cadmium efflux system protein